jgi:tetratricopeptide (TPR) repeat protein
VFRPFRIVWLLLPGLAASGAPLDESVALFRSRQFGEAQAKLEQLVAAEPKNAAACYYLGMTLRERAGPTEGLKAALVWLKKAADLEPNNADYLADYGGTALLYAEKHRSITAAIHGRDAMEQALRLDPHDTDTRQALFEFYMQAPWPLGSQAKAAAHLEAIRKSDRARAEALGVRVKTDSRDFDGAFRDCDALLAANPADYSALYEYGGCAARSGRNLERGLGFLQRALTLPPPSPASPNPGKIWCLIGELHAQLGHPDQARAAYESALKFDAADATAAAALAKLK